MASSKKTLLIIDGHAVLHRAWHALPPLTTKKGLVISGAYGFTMLLLRAIKDLSPTHVAVTFDLEGPTFRHEAYDAYKATREEKPDELYAQIPIIEELLTAMHIPFYGVQGFEADDVIGTIARKVTKKKDDVTVIIVTGDKDLLQLVDDRVSVYHLRQGVSDMVMYGPKEVRAKLGITPEQLVDFKALRGDPSDNIPGVKGVGEKTATQLIQEFGNIAAIYDALEKDGKKAAELKPSVRKNLAASKKDAFQALDLCRIRTDVKVDFSLKEAKYTPPTQDDVRDAFTTYEFHKLLSQLPGGAQEPQPADAPRGLKRDEKAVAERKEHVTDHEGAVTAATSRASMIIRDASDVAAALLPFLRAKRIAFRTLSDGDKVHPRLDMFAITDGERTVVFTPDTIKEALPSIVELLASKDIEKICHDLKREIIVLGGNGVAISEPSFDVMIGFYLLHSGERRSAIDAVMTYYRRPLAPKGSEEAEQLAAEVSALIPISEDVRGEIRAQNLDELYSTIEHPLAGVLAKVERNGIEIDAPYFLKLSKDLGKRIDALTGKIFGHAGREFNINSPAQLQVVLFEEMGLSPEGMKRTAKSKSVSTAASELMKIRGQHEIIDDILDFRELSKLKSTYVDALPPLVNDESGRIHADFNQTVTATGRLSSSDPNLQNIPTPDTEYGRKVRDGFVAAKGYSFVAADYSQIELRLAAHYADEKTMIEAFRNGEDIHRRTAANMFGEDKADTNRRIAKVINFGILYGMGPTRLAESADISFAEAREYIDTYFAMHPGIADYMERMRGMIREDGYVETLFGRKRFFRNIDLMNQRELAEAERQAINMPLQGTQADMIKIAMLRIDEKLTASYGPSADSPARMVIQVHDELVFEVRDDLIEDVIGIVVGGMEGVVKLQVPVVVDVAVGKRWGSMEKRK